MKLLIVLVLGSVVACAKPHPVSTSRMGGVFPARPADCALELRSETLNYELTSTYDTIGMVNVQGKSGEAPNDPRILALVKPEACGLGGELVLVVTSANVENVSNGDTSSNHSYLVMRRKTNGPAPAQSF